MDSVLMQTFVEKVQALEKDLGELKDQTSGQQEAQRKADSRVEEVEQAFKKLLTALSFPVEQAERLSSQLTLVCAQLRRLKQQEVHHHHHPSKAIIAAVVLFVAAVVLTVLLTQSRSRSRREQESDLKYRYLKLSPDTGLQRILFHTDSLYLGDAKNFGKKVLEEEARQQEQWRLQQQIEKKEKEVRLLKQKTRKTS